MAWVLWRQVAQPGNWVLTWAHRKDSGMGGTLVCEKDSVLERNETNQ